MAPPPAYGFPSDARKIYPRGKSVSEESQKFFNRERSEQENFATVWLGKKRLSNENEVHPPYLWWTKFLCEENSKVFLRECSEQENFGTFW